MKLLPAWSVIYLILVFPNIILDAKGTGGDGKNILRPLMHLGTRSDRD